MEQRAGSESVPMWKRELLKPIENAVINGALGLTDAEINEVVRQALIRARRMLSS